MIRISIFIYLLFSTFSVVGFFMPIYLQGKGLNSGQIGTVIASGSMISMVAQPFWGFVSDRRKTVKRVLLLLMICSLTVSAGLFSVGAFIFLMLLYMMFMFFNSASGPLSETLCYAYAHQHNKEFGRMRLWGEVGVGVSALMLGIIVERIGLHHLWSIYAILMSLAILSGFLLRDTKTTPVPVNFKALGSLFTKPRLLWFLVLVLIVGIPHKMNDTLLSLYLVKLGAPDSVVGLAWLAATLSAVPALIFVGRLLKRWNEIGILTIAAAAYSVRWAIYSLTDSPSVLIAAQTFHCLTFPFFLVASIQYLSTLVPAELRASGQAAFAVTFGGLGGIIGSVGGGYAYEQLGASSTYAIGSGLAALGAAAFFATYIWNGRMSNRLAAGGRNESL